MNIFNRSKIYLAKYRKVVYNVCKRLYKNPVKKRKTTTTKKILWICLANGILWVWCSYVLAFVGMFRDNYTGASIAESLSSVAVTEIIGVVLVYCLKSLFEKRKDFGEVGKDEAL